MRISAWKEFDQEMVYRFINYQAWSEAEAIGKVFENFLPKNSTKVSLYAIHKPENCSNIAEIRGDEFGMSISETEKEYLIIPRTQFRQVSATDNTEEVKYREVKRRIRQYLKDPKTKAQKVTFWQLQLVEARHVIRERNSETDILAEESKWPELDVAEEEEKQQPEEEEEKQPQDTERSWVNLMEEEDADVIEGSAFDETDEGTYLDIKYI